MSIYGLNNREIIREIGRRLRRTRLAKNVSQEQLAERAGLDRTTVGKLERGASSSVMTLVRYLRALDSLETLGAFLPDPGPSPLELAKLKGRERRRASRRTAEQKNGETKRGATEW